MINLDVINDKDKENLIDIFKNSEVKKEKLASNKKYF